MTLLSRHRLLVLDEEKIIIVADRGKRGPNV